MLDDCCRSLTFAVVCLCSVVVCRVSLFVVRGLLLLLFVDVRCYVWSLAFG